LKDNVTGYYNVALGSHALSDNTTGIDNVAVGTATLYANQEGNLNTAIGSFALVSNATSENTAVGAHALEVTSLGAGNVAVGTRALNSNNNGSVNTAVGLYAMRNNTDGTSNTAVGVGALGLNTTGTHNTAIGANAFPNGAAITNSTAIGFEAEITTSNEVRIGNRAVTRIGGQVNWSAASDGRFKTSIRENVPGLDFITRLRPVTYRINHAVIAARESTQGIPADLTIHTGFIAQEVEAAARAIQFDFSGVNAPANAQDWYSLSYAEFVVPLVKAVQEQQIMLKTLQAQLEVQEALLKKQQQAIEQFIKNSEATHNDATPVARAGHE
jgi:hypothetical protein